jgi:hypothetical protein
VRWKHEHPDEPVVLYSELDERRMERRKIDIFPDGRWGHADGQEEVGGTMLGEAPTPSVEQISADPLFEAEEIEEAEFEKLWAVRHGARIMSPFPVANEGGDPDAQRGNMGRTPKDEATDLMNMLVPFAEKMLREHGEFYLYGGVMMPDGSMQHFAASDGTEHPKSSDLMDLLVAKFREDGRQGKYKAIGIVYDVRTLPPGASEKTDAIAVRLDHEAGYSAMVMIPYRLVEGQLMKGTTFAVKGDGSIFPTH